MFVIASVYCFVLVILEALFGFTCVVESSIESF